jgi:multidomain signaling protein FimX
MATPSPVRLLIADTSQNRAHELDSMLRNAGIATRPDFCPDLHSAVARVLDRDPDIMLCAGEIDSLELVLPGLRKRQPDLPIIVLTPGDEPARMAHAMAIGATDVVFENDPQRLLYVVQRELHHVSQRQYLCEARRALNESERRCRLLLENATSAIAYVHEGMHIHANDDYLKLFGFDSLDDLLGLPLLDLVDGDSSAEFKIRIKAFRAHGEELTFPFVGRSIFGARVEGELTLAPAAYEGESCTQVLVRQRMAGAGEQAEAAPPAPASEAPLPAASAAADGAALADTIDRFVEFVSKRLTGSEPEVLLALALDDFHELQAAHGLRFAENVVRAVEHSLHTTAAGGVVVRIGEHSFALGIEADAAEGAVTAEQLRKTVEATIFEIDGKTIRCTATIGAVHIAEPAQIGTGLDLAFRTMIRGRVAGNPNQIHWFERDAAAAGVTGSVDADRKVMLRRVQQAIEQNRLALLFQPTISLRGDSDEHYEVFLRMLDEHGTAIRPDHFLQVAVENGAALKIDRWVVLQSIKALAAHRARGHDTRLTLNLTSNALCDAEFGNWLAVAMKAARLPSDALVLQISEPDAALYLRQATAFVETLHALHCRASLAHFGSSRNAFDTLRRLPVDYVKLDGSLLQNIEQDAERRKRLTRTISALQAMGKLTIVPTVESASELTALWQAGTNYIQGNYLQEPLPEMGYDFSSDD